MAEWDGRVVGFLLGCLDTALKERINKTELARPLFYKALRRGHYFRPKSVVNFARRMWGIAQTFGIRGIMRGEVKRLMHKIAAIKTEYPAHCSRRAFGHYFT